MTNYYNFKYYCIIIIIHGLCVFYASCVIRTEGSCIVHNFMEVLSEVCVIPAGTGKQFCELVRDTDPEERSVFPDMFENEMFKGMFIKITLFLSYGTTILALLGKA